MKRIAFVAAVVAALAALIVPTGLAKPLKPGPAQEARLDATSAGPESGWTGAAVLGGLAAVGIAGTGIVVVRGRSAGRASQARIRPALRSESA